MINYWSFAGMGPYLIAVPDTDDATKTGPYVWINQGVGNAFTQPVNAPGGRVGAIVGQFLMVGDVLQAQTQVIGTGNGSQSTFNFGLNDIPMLDSGNVYDQAGLLAGTFQNGLITGSGLLTAPSLPGTLASIGDSYLGSSLYVNSVFSLNTTSNPGQNAFVSITANSVTLNSASASYNFNGTVATWVWTNGPFGFGSNVTYPVSLAPYATSIVGGTNMVATNGFAPYTLNQFTDSYSAGAYSNSSFALNASSDPGVSLFTSLTVNGKTFTSSSAFYSYFSGVASWVWNTGPFGLTNGATLSVSFAGAAFFSNVTSGQINSGSLHPISTIGFALTPAIGSIGAQSSFNGFQLSSATGSVETAGLSQVNYESGDLTLVLSGAPPVGDQIFARYTQAAPSRVQWSAIGDPTRWPVPLTADAIAFQSGFEDLEVDLGPVMFIAGYPLYGIIFQRTGITRANYVGGNVVWSFGVFSKNRGLIAKGSAIQVATLVYFLSQDGWMVTDGNSVNPIGTDPSNDVGIDGWFWANVNIAALSSIRSGYDTDTRCITWSIPTGSSTLPDTLLTFNPLANRWTKSAIPTTILWTDNNGATDFGTQLRLGIFDQSNQYDVLQGPTLNGYCESLDLMDTDGQLRFTLGVRPNIVSTDTPQAMIGTRNSMQDALSYTQSMPPDSFSRIVPVLGEGLYTRVRVSSSNAQNIIGATIDQQTGSPV